jgi:N-methylhydantoinase A/oxoprolinase/acetone carboxylase beta subunit
MVEAVDVHTVGLGGDSQVQVSGKSAARDWLKVGPRRVVPLALLADQSPEVIRELRLQLAEGQKDEFAGQFVLANRKPTHKLAEEDRELLAQLESGPKSLIWLATEVVRHRFLINRQLERLRSQRLVLQAGFTPTDALHLLGQFDGSAGSAGEASRLGAELLAKKAGLSPEEFCQRVVATVSDRVATELVSKVMSDETVLPNWEKEPTAMALLTRALNGSGNSGLDCRLTLKQPVVAIGAPVEAYFPRTTAQLNTELVIPDHAGVANAVGAVAGGVVQQFRVLIHTLDSLESIFRAHLPNEVHDFHDLEEAVVYSENVVSEYLAERTRQAGADHVEVKVQREDQIAPIAANWGGEIYLGTQLTFTAVGRPSLATPNVILNERSE